MLASARLRNIRASRYGGDEVDEESHLRAADLDVVLAAAELQLRADQTALSDIEPGGSLSADDLGKVA